MVLSDIRNKVMELSGRWDLDDVEAYVGVDEFIEAGQKLLDTMLDTGKTVARHFQDLAYGQILVQVPGIRSLEKLFIVRGDERTELVKADYDKLREYYKEKHSTITPGTPGYWAPVCIRPYPSEVYPALYNQEWAFDDIVDSGSEHINGILLMPPCDSGTLYTLEIRGKFWTEMPTGAEGTSYWISQHPLLLIFAALFKIEESYGNVEASKTRLEAVKLGVGELNKDAIEEEDINQMEG